MHNPLPSHRSSFADLRLLFTKRRSPERGVTVQAQPDHHAEAFEASAHLHWLGVREGPGTPREADHDSNLDGPAASSASSPLIPRPPYPAPLQIVATLTTPTPIG